MAASIDQADGASGEGPLWEVFTQEKQGAPHEHAGSVHAPDAELALQNARDVYASASVGSASTAFCAAAFALGISSTGLSTPISQSSAYESASPEKASANVGSFSSARLK